MKHITRMRILLQFWGGITVLVLGLTLSAGFSHAEEELPRAHRAYIDVGFGYGYASGHNFDDSRFSIGAS